MISKQIEMIREDCARVLTDPTPLEALKNKSVFISGGTGFIGSWLTEFIAYLNDNFGFGSHVILMSWDAYRMEESAPHLACRSDVTLIDSDVRSDFQIPAQCSWIVHLAGTPDNRVHISNPLGVMDTIINGTRQVLHAASRLSNLKNFLNVSSSLVYGSQPWEMERLSEGYLGSVDCAAASYSYAEAKRVAETYCHVYRTQFRFPVVNVRPFAFVGPYQFAFSGPHHLMERPWAINNFIHRAFEGGPIRITCDEETVRSYMYPSDMAFWLLRILTAGRSGMTFNLGSPWGFTLRQVAETVASCFEDPPLIDAPPPQRNLMRSKSVPDTSRAKEYLGLDLTVGLENAIKRTVEWIQCGNLAEKKSFMIVR